MLCNFIRDKDLLTHEANNTLCYPMSQDNNFCYPLNHGYIFIVLDIFFERQLAFSTKYGNRLTSAHQICGDSVANAGVINDTTK